jgi:hypothetical protein
VKIDNSERPLTFASPENTEEQPADKEIKIPPLSVVVVMDAPLANIIQMKVE